MCCPYPLHQYCFSALNNVLTCTWVTFTRTSSPALGSATPPFPLSKAAWITRRSCSSALSPELWPLSQLYLMTRVAATAPTAAPPAPAALASRLSTLAIFATSVPSPLNSTSPLPASHAAPLPPLTPFCLSPSGSSSGWEGDSCLCVLSALRYQQLAQNQLRQQSRHTKCHH